MPDQAMMWALYVNGVPVMFGDDFPDTDNDEWQWLQHLLGEGAAYFGQWSRSLHPLTGDMLQTSLATFEDIIAPLLFGPIDGDWAPTPQDGVAFSTEDDDEVRDEDDDSAHHDDCECIECRPEPESSIPLVSDELEAALTAAERSTSERRLQLHASERAARGVGQCQALRNDGNELQQCIGWRGHHEGPRGTHHIDANGTHWRTGDMIAPPSPESVRTGAERWLDEHAPISVHERNTVTIPSAGDFALIEPNVPESRECPSCHGAGVFTGMGTIDEPRNETCHTCSGLGFVSTERGHVHDDLTGTWARRMIVGDITEDTPTPPDLPLVERTAVDLSEIVQSITVRDRDGNIVLDSGPISEPSRITRQGVTIEHRPDGAHVSGTPLAHLTMHEDGTVEQHVPWSDPAAMPMDDVADAINRVSARRIRSERPIRTFVENTVSPEALRSNLGMDVPRETVPQDNPIPRIAEQLRAMEPVFEAFNVAMQNAVDQIAHTMRVWNEAMSRNGDWRRLGDNPVDNPNQSNRLPNGQRPDRYTATELLNGDVRMERDPDRCFATHQGVGCLYVRSHPDMPHWNGSTHWVGPGDDRNPETTTLHDLADTIRRPDDEPVVTFDPTMSNDRARARDAINARHVDLTAFQSALPIVEWCACMSCEEARTAGFEHNIICTDETHGWCDQVRRTHARAVARRRGAPRLSRGYRHEDIERPFAMLHVDEDCTCLGCSRLDSEGERYVAFAVCDRIDCQWCAVQSERHLRSADAGTFTLFPIATSPSLGGFQFTRQWRSRITVNEGANS